MTGTCLEPRVVNTAQIGDDLAVIFRDLAGDRQTCASGFALTVYQLAD